MNPLPRILFAALVLALLAALIGHFLYHFQFNWPAVGSAFAEQWEGGWAFPVDAAMGLVTVTALWLAAAGWGLWLLRVTGADASLPSPWQQMALGLLCGWVFLGTGALFLGLAGLCNRTALGLWVLAVAAWGTQGWTPFFRRLIRHPTAVSELSLSGWVMLGAGLVYLIAVPYALTPSIQSDELRYHLAAPATWLALGRIEYLPNQAFSNFPFLVEMLFMIALALQGAEGAHMVHLAFLESCAVLIALLAWLLIRETTPRGPRIDDGPGPGTRTLAGLAGVAFAAIPTATILACWSFVDIATCAYFLAMAYVGGLMLVSRRPPPAWMMGVMAGGAMGTKYSMIPLCIAVALCFMPLLAAARGVASLRSFMPALGLALVLVAPWLVRNALWTGNPVYPLAYSVFGGEDWSAQNADFYAAKAAEKGFSATATPVFSEGGAPPSLTLADKFSELGLPVAFLTAPTGRVFELAISPITTALFPRAFEDHYLGPLPLAAMLLALVGLILSVTRREARPAGRPPVAPLFLWIFGLTAGSWLFWFLTYQSNRLLLPALALLFSAGAWGIFSLLRMFRDSRLQRHAGVALALLLTLGLLHSWSYSAVTIGAGMRPHPWPRALGWGSRDAYIGSALNYYGAARWLDGQLGEDRHALLIGEHRTMYFPAGAIASDWFDTPQPLPLIRATPDNDALFARLAADGVEYVVFNQAELRGYAQAYFRPRFTDAEWLRFDAFLRDARLEPVWHDPDHPVYIFKLKR